MQRVLLMMLFAMLPATNSAQSATERDAVLKIKAKREPSPLGPLKP